MLINVCLGARAEKLTIKAVPYIVVSPDVTVPPRLSSKALGHCVIGAVSVHSSVCSHLLMLACCRTLYRSMKLTLCTDAAFVAMVEAIPPQY